MDGSDLCAIVISTDFVLLCIVAIVTYTYLYSVRKFDCLLRFCHFWRVCSYIRLTSDCILRFCHLWRVCSYIRLIDGCIMQPVAFTALVHHNTSCWNHTQIFVFFTQYASEYRRQCTNICIHVILTNNYE